MNLDDIPSGDRILIDANIFIYASQQLSHQCKRLLLRCADEDLYGILSVHILAEIMHQFMIAEARDNDWIKGANPARQLAENPRLVRKLNRYDDLIRDILSIGLQLEPLTQEDFLTAMNIQRRFGLLTNEGLTVATAQRLRVKAIATADKIFKRVEGLVVYSPDDLKS